MNLNKNQIVKIVFSSVVILLVAVLGSVFVNIGMTWFNNLVKPSQWLANVLIPIVWTVIYSIFAVINFLWIKNDDNIPTNTTILMVINAVLNVLWCLVFFTFKQLFLGNIFIILNLIFGFTLIINILKQKTLYAYVLSIYPIWLSIATTLNLTLWISN